MIASGLKVGEQVITEGADRLKEGSRVSLAGDAPRGGGRRPGVSAATGAAAASAANGVSSLPSPSSSAPASQVGSTKPVDRATTAAPGAGANDSAPAPTAKAPPLPNAEQRLKMLERVKDDPVALERRKRFFELLDKGDPDALERWKGMAQRIQGGGERPVQ